MHSTPTTPPLLTVVILTRNRIERCLDCVKHTAHSIRHIPSRILTINNGGSPVPLPQTIDGVPCRLINMERNMGAAARNIALTETNSELLLMLDDDAYIDQASIDAMITAFRSDSHIGAVAFQIENDNHEESCLLPSVFHGCACAFRSKALARIGGYPSDFLYYGEEYSVAFRLYQAEYKIVMLNVGTKVRHARDTKGRNTNRIIRLLISNNIRLWFSSLPWRDISPVTSDTLKRYALVAKKEQSLFGYYAGLALLPVSIIRGLRYRATLKENIWNRISLLHHLEKAITMLKTESTRDIVICGVGKFPSLWLNLLTKRGFRVKAFLDHNSCWQNQFIRNIPVHVLNEQETLESILPSLKTSNGQHLLFLAGLSSLSENKLWQIFLDKEANNATSEVSDLLMDSHLSIHSSLS